MKWLRESISDTNGQADVAYVSLFTVTGAVLGAIFFLCALSAWAFFSCTEKFDVDPIVLCRFDPQPLGIAIAAVCGGFSTALGALAAYMLATRRRDP